MIFPLANGLSIIPGFSFAICEGKGMELAPGAGIFAKNANQGLGKLQILVVRTGGPENGGLVSPTSWWGSVKSLQTFSFLKA